MFDNTFCGFVPELLLKMYNDRKVAKKQIKIAKKHPNWYTKQDVRYAKMIKRKLKQEKKDG